MPYFHYCCITSPFINEPYVHRCRACRLAPVCFYREAEVICCKTLPNITDKLSTEANSMGPEHTAPMGAVLSGSTLFAIEATLTFQPTTFVAIGALRVKIYTGLETIFIFDEMLKGYRTPTIFEEIKTFCIVQTSIAQTYQSLQCLHTKRLHVV